MYLYFSRPLMETDTLVENDRSNAKEFSFSLFGYSFLLVYNKAKSGSWGDKNKVILFGVVPSKMNIGGSFYVGPYVFRVIFKEI